jgi:hypothetical protein
VGRTRGAACLGYLSTFIGGSGQCLERGDDDVLGELFWCYEVAEHEPQVVIDAITAVQHAARTGTLLRDAASCANRPG